MATINHLYNCAIYLNGGAHIGTAESVKLPELNPVMSEVSGLGLIGKFEIPSGMDMLEATIVWNGPYESALLLTSNPTRSIDLMIRGALELYTSGGRQETQSFVATMLAIPKSGNMGEFKQNERLNVETAFSVYSFKLEIAGRNVVEYDALSNTYKVGTDDISRQFRVALGLV